MTENNEKNDFNSVRMIMRFWQYRKVLIVVTLAAAFLSVGVSLLLKDKYSSSVIVFPMSESTTSHDLLFFGTQPDVMMLGKEEEVDQMLQVMESDDIVGYIIQKYDLLSHYEIDEDKDKYPEVSVRRKFKSNVKITATKYMSISIQVTDRDPQMAADIANEIAEQTNVVINKMFKKKAVEAFKLVEREYLQLKSDILECEDSLNTIRALGIQDYETQTERLTEALGLAMVQNNKRAERDLEAKLAKIGKYGGPYLDLIELKTVYFHRLERLEEKYVEAKVNSYEELDRVFVLSKAHPSSKKSSPKRSAIVLASSAVTFFLVLVILVLRDSVKNYIREE